MKIEKPIYTKGELHARYIACVQLLRAVHPYILWAEMGLLGRTYNKAEAAKLKKISEEIGDWT